MVKAVRHKAWKISVAVLPSHAKDTRPQRVETGSEKPSSHYLVLLLLLPNLGPIFDLPPAWMVDLSWNPQANIFPFVTNLT